MCSQKMLAAYESLNLGSKIYLDGSKIRCGNVIRIIFNRREKVNSAHSPNVLVPIPRSLLLSLKVHKIEIFFGFDFEICIISLLVMSKY